MLLLFWIGCSNPLEECRAGCDKLESEWTYEKRLAECKAESDKITEPKSSDYEDGKIPDWAIENWEMAKSGKMAKMCAETGGVKELGKVRRKKCLEECNLRLSQ